MTDLALIWHSDEWSADLVLAAGGDLQTDDGLQTAVVISLFSDRRAAADDALPTSSTDPRGWWGDAFSSAPGDQIGSRLWLLSRSKATADVVLKAQEYGAEALAWMIADDVASDVAVVASDGGQGWLKLAVTITRPTGQNHQFDFLWNAMS